MSKIKVEEILNKRIIKFPESPDMSDKDIRRNVKAAIKEIVEAVLDKAAEEAECEDGAIVDLGFEIISASVKKQSILDIKKEIDYE